MNFINKIFFITLIIIVIIVLSISLTGCLKSTVGEDKTVSEVTAEELKEEIETVEEEAEKIEETPGQEDQSVDAPDIIFFNGTVLTLDSNLSQVQAIAIKDEFILAVSSDNEILAMQGPETSIVDLKGKILMPGIVDAHTHVFNDAETLMEMDLLQAQELTIENGITCLGDMCVLPEFLPEMQEFEQSRKLKVRTSLYLLHNTNCGELMGDWYKEYSPTRRFGEILRIGGVKVMADGGSCGTPAVSFELPFDLGYGDLWFTQEEMNQMISDIHDLGYQVAVHATGDRAIEQVQNAIELVLAGQPNTMRHRMEHNVVGRPDLLPRYGEIGIIPVLFGYYPTCIENNEGNWEPYANEEQLSWVRNNRAILDANPGLVFAWHSDYPWVGGVIDPFKQLYALVTRKEVAPDGVTICEPPDWLAKTTITVEEAVKMMTTGAAYSLFRDEEVGSLVPGKLADLIIVSENPLSVDPDDIKDIRVLLTMIGGKVEYCMPGEEDLCP
jgi:predicted amidohydrolase YtcJ